MKLDLQFTSCSMEEMQCDAVVGFVFQGCAGGERDSSGLDAITRGNISRLYDKEFLTGDLGETLLLLSPKMIKADKMLLAGLGPHSTFHMPVLLEGIQVVAQTLEGLKVNDFGVRIPDIPGSGMDFSLCVRKTCIRLVDFFLCRHTDEADFCLRILVSLGKNFIDDLEITVGHLKEYLHSKLDYTIIFDRTDSIPSPCSAFL